MIEIYSRAFCGYCDAAKNLLKAKGLEFTEIRVDMDPDQLPKMLERTNGARSMPQIFINGEHIGGFTDLRALDQQGKL